jgi:hypothetical protein
LLEFLIEVVLPHLGKNLILVDQIKQAGRCSRPLVEQGQKRLLILCQRKTPECPVKAGVILPNGKGSLKGIGSLGMPL